MKAKILPVIFSCAILLSGCQGSGGNVSREEYARQANAICDKYAERVRKIPQAPDPTDRTATARQLDRLADEQAGQVAELGRLERPSDDVELLAGIFAGTEKVIALERQVAQSIQQGAPDAQQKTVELGRAIRTDNEKYDEYGMKRCGSGQNA